MKSKLLRVIILSFASILILAGVGSALYPFLSDYYNAIRTTHTIHQTVEGVNNLTDDKYADILADAQEYNKNLIHDVSRFNSQTQDHELYNSLLDPAGYGVMGYVSIPQAYVYLPIYHGTESNVLVQAIGHMEGSSLPVGGKSTHAVLSGHTGISSATLFSYIDTLEIGDRFTITVLHDVLTYEVEAINKVLPDDLSLLEIQEGRDLVTLVTCTPIGVNTHRLLVTAKRVPTDEGEQPADVAPSIVSAPPYTLWISWGFAGLVMIALIVGVVLRIRKNL